MGPISESAIFASPIGWVPICRASCNYFTKSTPSGERWPNRDRVLESHATVRPSANENAPTNVYIGQILNYIEYAQDQRGINAHCTKKKEGTKCNSLQDAAFLRARMAATPKITHSGCH